MVGCRIKEELSNQGRTQVWLSKATNIPAAQISLMLNGKRKIHVDSLELFCGALEIEPNKVIMPKRVS